VASAAVGYAHATVSVYDVRAEGVCLNIDTSAKVYEPPAPLEYTPNPAPFLGNLPIAHVPLVILSFKATYTWSALREIASICDRPTDRVIEVYHVTSPVVSSSFSIYPVVFDFTKPR
jgi:hypothetical protein